MIDDASRELASRNRVLAWLALGLAMLAAPWVLYGARSALKSTSNDPRQWLPSQFDATDVYDRFEQRFGTDEVAVVSWEGATMDDDRVDQLAQSLRESAYFDDALSGPAAVAELEESGVPRSLAIRRLQRILIGEDGVVTCVVLITSDAGRADRTAAVSEIIQQAKTVSRIEAEYLRLAGPTVDAAAIDAESRRLLFQLAGLSALVSFIVATLRMRSFKLAVMILVVSVYSTGLSLAIVYFSGGEMNLLMTMLPPLVYVLSISAAVHLANYYRDAAEHHSSDDAVRIAVRHGWTPCVLAAATTAIGLVSLVLSKIGPIREFGTYAAIGVVASAMMLFLLLPSALLLFPPRSDSSRKRSTIGNGVANEVVRQVVRFRVGVSVVCLTMMGLAAWAIPSVESTVKLQDRFLESSDVIGDYRWLESNIGPMVPLEVVVRFTRDDPRTIEEKLQLIATVQRKINGLSDQVATFSALNISPPLPRPGSSVRSVIQRKVLNRESTIDRFRERKLLAESDSHQLWRITVRARAIGDLDYGYFSETIRDAVDPVLESDSASAIYTGVIPLIYKAQRQLLQDLVRSFLAAFAVIAVILILVLRSVFAAALAMVPNLFPAIVVFGSMEWVDISVQIGSVMTASAALGIAVDDTVHFLTWFRRGMNSGSSRLRSLYVAFRRCAGAMTHTTAICASGLMVFTISSFVPILHFAWLMVFLLLAALVGDLVLLPAILASRFGRLFERRTFTKPLQETVA